MFKENHLIEVVVTPANHYESVKWAIHVLVFLRKEDTTMLPSLASLFTRSRMKEIERRWVCRGV